MSSKDNTFALACCTTNTIRKNSISYTWVHCRKRIVEKIYICITKNCPCQRDSSFLPARNVYASFANYGVHSFRKRLQIMLKLTYFQCICKSFCIKYPTKRNIFFYRCRKNKGLLFYIG